MNRRNFLLATSTITAGTIYGRSADARRLGRRRGQDCPCPTATGIQRATEIRASFGDAVKAAEESLATYHWWAQHDGLHHSRGEAHSNGKWWVDDMDTGSSGRWTCWGPYVNLSRGRWKAAWNVYVEGRSAGVQVIAMDIVAFGGDVEIVHDTIFRLPAGQTQKDGSVSLEFRLGEDFDGVEARIRPVGDTRLLIAKDLWISTL